MVEVAHPDGDTLDDVVSLIGTTIAGNTSAAGSAVIVVQGTTVMRDTFISGNSPVCIFTYAAADFVLDVTGYVTG